MMKNDLSLLFTEFSMRVRMRESIFFVVVVDFGVFESADMMKVERGRNFFGN